MEYLLLQSIWVSVKNKIWAGIRVYNKQSLSQHVLERLSHLSNFPVLEQVKDSSFPKTRH